ncbi:hypothetical protein [Haliangium sp.]|uniref:hypothetical protein n=1 Tax=Haliangium sp. TaxID=2663208 RepID=UPI003D0E94E2
MTAHRPHHCLRPRRRSAARAWPAVGVVLGLALAPGCQGDLHTEFTLSVNPELLRRPAACGTAETDPLRMSCDAVFRFILGPRSLNEDQSESVCWHLRPNGIDDLRVLTQVDLEFDDSWFSFQAMTAEVHVYRYSDPNADVGVMPACPVLPDSDRVLTGRADFLRGDDQRVDIRLNPTSNAHKLNLLECGLEVEIADLEQGTELGYGGVPPVEDEPDAPLLPTAGLVAPDQIEVSYGWARPVAGGGYQFERRGTLSSHVYQDGRTTWRGSQSKIGIDFWDAADNSGKLCFQVRDLRRPDSPPQLTCHEVTRGVSSGTMAAFFLSEADLDCLLRAGEVAIDADGDGEVDGIQDGLVIGRVVECGGDRQGPTPAVDVPVRPEDGNQPFRVQLAQEPLVQYVDKPEGSEDACNLVERSGTTASGYFLSPAEFPSRFVHADDPASPATLGGSMSGVVSLVRIELDGAAAQRTLSQSALQSAP